MNTTFIYVLKCPLSGEVRYVGKSNNPDERYKDHLNRSRDGGTYKRNWINSLRKNNLKPIFEIIKEVSVGKWKIWEKYYIKHYRDKGCKLVNIMGGGDGLTFGNQTSFKKGAVSWNKGSRMKKRCAICDKKFEVSPSGNKKYKCCSMECSSIYRSVHPNKGCFKKGVVAYKDRLVPVIQMDKETGDVINIFKSQMDACRATGINQSHISGVIIGNRKSAGGFIWERGGDLK